MSYPNKKDLTESDKVKITDEANWLIDNLGNYEITDYLDGLDKSHRYLLQFEIDQIRGSI